ncbi:diaminopimelate epimerase [Desulfomicrobium sp. ZS1]|uniref:diaminopimelate epimerase n=1 Tax=Desulfomicrobium sp. ZS1 TaxID=2952228 RepID=UPI0020B30FF0|nr:diaminopimelate epimerase [Desulfomicrobium sp. ZS1]UTF50961.1 diaminopimelate epimerase [Desulfomicrobium sp. ZS1]
MTIFTGPTQFFYKMQGSGNDFIVIDNRAKTISPEDMPRWAKTLCPHAFSIGADGIIFLEIDDSGQAATRWHFFNADGSRAEMCGNGSRCATLLAYTLGMAPAKHLMLTDAGTVHAQVFPEAGEVNVQLTPARDMALNVALDLDGRTWTAHFANTGVPHTVVVTPDVKSIDVKGLGAKVRYHDHFAPAGTNANFIQVVSRSELLLRTYERGVESETYACGTGAAASVAVAHALGLCDPKAKVTTSGGEVLEISVHGSDIFLRGKAQLVYKGEFCPAALGL